MRDLTSLDLKFLIPELESLRNGRIQKIYQLGKNIWFEVFVSGQGTKYFYFSPGKVFLSDTKIKGPMNPEGFAMLLRKYLSGQKILDISQPGFERIIDIETEHYVLHLEIFSKGNAVLCDKAGVIIQPLEKQHWKDRNIYPGKSYKYPPAILDIFEMSIQEYEQAFEGKKKQIVIFLAIKMGLSGVYAEEICYRAGVEKSTPAKDLTEDQIVAIRDALLTLEKRPVDIKGYTYPIEMKTLGLGEPIPSFSETLDEFYLETIRPVEKDDEQERILVGQKKSVEKWADKKEDRKLKAQILQRNYDTVNSIITGLQKARDGGMAWKEIKEKISSDPKLSSIITEIQEDQGIIVLELE